MGALTCVWDVPRERDYRFCLEDAQQIPESYCLVTTFKKNDVFPRKMVELAVKSRDEQTIADCISEHYRAGRIFCAHIGIGDSIAHLLSRNHLEVFGALHNLNRILKNELQYPDFPARYLTFQESISFGVHNPLFSPEYDLDLKIDRDFSLRINVNRFEQFRRDVYSEETSDSDEIVYLGTLFGIPLNHIHCMYISEPLLAQLRTYDWNSVQHSVDRMKTEHFAKLDIILSKIQRENQ